MAGSRGQVLRVVDGRRYTVVPPDDDAPVGGAPPSLALTEAGDLLVLRSTAASLDVVVQPGSMSTGDGGASGWFGFPRILPLAVVAAVAVAVFLRRDRILPRLRRLRGTPAPAPAPPRTPTRRQAREGGPEGCGGRATVSSRMSQVADGASTQADDGVIDESGDESGGRTDERARATAREWRARLRDADKVLLAAVAVATITRFWGIGTQSLWYDEWLTGNAASGDLDHLRRYVTDQAGIPPTYFAIMWVWARVVADGDGALRVLSAIVGIATVPAMFAAVRELATRRAARMAAVLTAVNPMLVWYSQEARPYSLLALVAALSLLFLARYRNDGRHRDLMWWALACACMIAVHYFALFLVLAEGAALLRLRRPAWRELALAARPAAVVLLVLAPFGIRQFSRRDNHSWIAGHRLPKRFGDFGLGAFVGPVPPDGRLWIVVAAVAVLGIVLVATVGGRRERRAALLAGGVGVLSIVIALAATVVGVDVVVARYLIGSMIVMLAAVAVGLGADRAPRGLGWAAVAVVCVVSLVVVGAGIRDPQRQRADWRAVAAAHETRGTDGTRLIVLNLHGYLGLPLLRYVEGARILDEDETVLVDQIDMVVAKPSDPPCNLFVGLECPMIFLGVPPPQPLAQQVHLEERFELDQFFLDRYRSAAPVEVTPADVVPADTLEWSLVIVSSGSP